MPDAPADLQPPGAPEDDRPVLLSDQRRTHLKRRLVVLAVVLGVLAAIAAPVYVVWDSDDGAGRPVGRNVAAPASTDRPTTTSTSSTTTTVPPTTAAPTTIPPAAPTPGITVGPLTEGPGPIPVVHRIPTFDPVVFLTIDDGVTPDAGGLQVIRDQHVPVTMFLTQRYMPANQDYFRTLLSTGTAVLESHTMTHLSLRGKDEPTQQHEICGPTADYQARYGVTPDLFRPPYGNWDATTLKVAAGCGMRAVVHWSATYDAGTLTTTGGPLRAGDIILLHFKPGLGLNLTALLAQIQAAGLRPAQLADYIRSAPPAPVPPPAAPATPPPTASPLPEGGVAAPA